MTEPDRIQRRRTKGWRMPEGAIYVGRPTKWGNPFKVGSEAKLPGQQPVRLDVDGTIRLYWVWLTSEITTGRLDPEELRGHDLVCWCSLEQRCHADLLLVLANRRALEQFIATQRLRLRKGRVGWR